MNQEEGEVVEEAEYEDNTLYKKFFRSAAKAGLISLQPWYDAGKINVDIGELNPAGGLKSSTNAWCSMIQLATFCQSVVTGMSKKLFNDIFTVYGGKQTSDGPISRALKISKWDAKSEDLSFGWKTATFKAKVTAVGAFIPEDTAHPLGMNMIKISPAEMAEISYRLNMGLISFAVERPDWAVLFATKKKS